MFPVGSVTPPQTEDPLPHIPTQLSSQDFPHGPTLTCPPEQMPSPPPTNAMWIIIVLVIIIVSQFSFLSSSLSWSPLSSLSSSLLSSSSLCHCHCLPHHYLVMVILIILIIIMIVIVIMILPCITLSSSPQRPDCMFWSSFLFIRLGPGWVASNRRGHASSCVTQHLSSRWWKFLKFKVFKDAAMPAPG